MFELRPIAAATGRNTSRFFWLNPKFVAMLALIVLSMAGAIAPAFAQSNPSGLPLPRFATTRSTPINVRVGPGTRYDVVFIYLKEGVPVEIIAEFDTWRKIRDVDGSEGWLHQNLLSGNRAGYVAPWNKEGQFSLFANTSEDSGVRAILGSGFRVQIKECDGLWCSVSATDQPTSGRGSTYSGYLHQNEIWGVYGEEKFD